MAGLLSTMRDGIPEEATVRFELQTNVTLLTEAWLDLFEQYWVGG
ncbi:hypothetical protein [Streptomyces milbemycinicus]